MIQQMLDFLAFFFTNASSLGIGLAVVFGAVWLAWYMPPLIKKPWLWAVLAGSAILMPLAVAFTELPIRIWIVQVMSHFWEQENILRWLLVTAILPTLLGGLVQEGAKLIPVLVYWWRKGKNLDPKLGLIAGAVAGAGFGILEAQWLYSYILASGWSWETVQTSGVVALAGFWEGFFIIAFHIASCALAGWGLAKGWGWQFYLLASLLHAFLKYSSILVQSEIVSDVQAELLIASWAMVVTGGVLWLRWGKTANAAAPHEAR